MKFRQEALQSNGIIQGLGVAVIDSGPLVIGGKGVFFQNFGICTAVKHGVAPANCVGVVDSDYRGEVMVGLHNHSSVDYTVRPEERVAQLVLMPVALPEVEECEALSDTNRGAGGFGSTGKL